MDTKKELLVKGLCFMLVLAVSPISVFAASPGSTFLRIGVGGQALGMGEAYVAVADDVNAIYWNPAGLAQISKPQIALSHNELYQSIRHEYAAYCHSFRGGVIGVSGTYLWIEGIEGRSSDTPDVERMVPVWDASAALAYAKKLSKKLNAGFTLKGIYRQLDDKTASGAAVDLGLLYKPGKGKPRIGLAVQNIGYETAFISEASSLPLTVKAGISNRYLKNKLLAAMDGNYSVVDGVWSLGTGFDWNLHKMFSLRFGYKYNNAMTTLGALAGISGGIGFEISKFSIDYAFVPYGDLGYTHRASILVKL